MPVTGPPASTINKAVTCRKLIASPAITHPITTATIGKEYYHRPPDKYQSLRLGFASLNEREMQEAVDLLAKAIR